MTRSTSPAAMTIHFSSQETPQYPPRLLSSSSPEPEPGCVVKLTPRFGTFAAQLVPVPMPPL